MDTACLGRDRSHSEVDASKTFQVPGGALQAGTFQAIKRSKSTRGKSLEPTRHTCESSCPALPCAQTPSVPGGEEKAVRHPVGREPSLRCPSPPQGRARALPDGDGAEGEESPRAARQPSQPPPKHILCPPSGSPSAPSSPRPVPYPGAPGPPSAVTAIPAGPRLGPPAPALPPWPPWPPPAHAPPASPACAETAGGGGAGRGQGRACPETAKFRQ